MGPDDPVTWRDRFAGVLVAMFVAWLALLAGEAWTLAAAAVFGATVMPELMRDRGR